MHVKCHVYTCYPEGELLKQYAVGSIEGPTYEAVIPEDKFEALRSDSKVRNYAFKDPITLIEDSEVKAVSEAHKVRREPKAAPKAPEAKESVKTSKKASKKAPKANASVEVDAEVDLDL